MGVVGATASAAMGAFASCLSAILWFLSELASTLSVYTFGTCIGFIIGATLVAAARGSLNRAEAEAERKAKERARKGSVDGKPPPLPIPQEVLSTALMHLPKWTKDPDCNRAAWLNNVLEVLWPHVDTSVSEVIRDSLEPLLRTIVPPIVSWIGFEKITLGPTPPTIGGVKVLGSNSEEVMLELEVNLASGADAVLAAYIFGVRVPVRLHDIQLRAYVRVTFTPLTDELPCLGGLEISLMGLPEHADLGLTIPPGIDLMALPGMYSALRLILRKFVAPLMVYPAKMTIPIMENSGVEARATGMIKLRAVEGTNMSARTKISDLTTAAAPPTGTPAKNKGRSMFRGVTSLVADRYVVQLFTRRSRRVTLASKSSDDPTWDETHFFLTNPEAHLTAVVLTTNMKELGRCEVPLRQLTAADRAKKIVRLRLPFADPAPFLKPEPRPRAPSCGRPTPEELEDINDEYELALQKHYVELATLRTKMLGRALRPTDDGAPSLTCELEYVPLGAEASTAADSDSEEEGEEDHRGILNVFIDRGVHILRNNATKLPKPCATVTCGLQTHVTEIPVEPTKMPRWDQNFVFFNVSPRDVINVRVNDKSPKGEFLGEFNLSVEEVAKDREVSDGFHLTGVKNAAQVFARARFAYMS